MYSASTVDQMPKQVSAGLMFGMALSMPIPDIDRTDYLLMLGANPFASNGSLMTAPDYPGRLRTLRARGGKLVVVDPRRSKTAEEADEHLFIRPGTDAHFLFAIVHTLFEEQLVSLGRPLPTTLTGVDEVERLAREFSPRRRSRRCAASTPTTIRRTARELAGRASRRGVRAHRDMHTGVRNPRELAGRRVNTPHRQPRPRRRRRCSRSRPPGARTRAARPASGAACASVAAAVGCAGLPEMFGELPVVCLAEEIETPGDGQVRGMITVAGNPVLSTPDCRSPRPRARSHSSSW